MIMLPYLCPCCGVLVARFSNFITFECSHRRDAITYTHDIFHNECKRPHHATRQISNLYIENKNHLLTLQKKFRLLLNKGVLPIYIDIVSTLSYWVNSSVSSLKEYLSYLCRLMDVGKWDHIQIYFVFPQNNLTSYTLSRLNVNLSKSHLLGCNCSGHTIWWKCENRC